MEHHLYENSFDKLCSVQQQFFQTHFENEFQKPLAKKCSTPLPNKIWNMKRRLNIFPPINFLQKSLKKMYERELEWACLKMRQSSGSSLHFWSTLKSLYRGNATTKFLLLLGLIQKVTGKTIGSIFQGNTSRTFQRHKVDQATSAHDEKIINSFSKSKFGLKSPLLPV